MMFYEEPSLFHLLSVIASSLHLLIHRNPIKYAALQKDFNFFIKSTVLHMILSLLKLFRAAFFTKKIKTTSLL